MTLQALLDQMLGDSRIYYVPEGLPGRSELLRLLPAEPEDLWRTLTPLQSFFVFETAPEYLRKAPREVVRSAYCAAMEVLPGDWWGPYGSVDTDTAQRLMRIEGIEGCLLRQLDNEKPLNMGDSESATLARFEKFQVADLAALFVANRYSVEYSMHRQPQERQPSRAALKKWLEGTP
jgi:hypothetical protein